MAGAGWGYSILTGWQEGAAFCEKMRHFVMKNRVAGDLHRKSGSQKR